MKTVLPIAIGLAVGLALGIVYSTIKLRLLRRRIRELKAELKAGPTARKKPQNILRSVTEFLFVTAQIFALGWVSVSYGIAVYSTVVLMQPFPVTELSQQAIDTILKVVGLKVIGNIFEHNESVVFGKSDQEEYPPPDSGDEEGVG